MGCPLPFYGQYCVHSNHFLGTQMNNLNRFRAFLANLVDMISQGLATKVETHARRQGRTQVARLPADFVQRTNPRKNQRRKAIKAVGGIRQFKKARRELRLAGQPVSF